MLRQTTFAIISLFACSVASAQYPTAPFVNYGRQTVNPALNGPNGFWGTQPLNCANGDCGTGQMICGPNGCYVPGTAPGSVNPYLPRVPQGSNWIQPAASWRYGTPSNGNYHIQPYPLPGSGFPGYPNLPAVRRDRALPNAGGSPLFGAPYMGGYNYYPPGAIQFDAYNGPGVLH